VNESTGSLNIPTAHVELDWAEYFPLIFCKLGLADHLAHQFQHEAIAKGSKKHEYYKRGTTTSEDITGMCMHRRP